MLLTHFRTWILGCLTKALLDDLSSKKNSSFETASWVWILKGGPLNWLGFARIVDHLAQQHFKTGQSNLRVKFIEHLAPWQKLVGVTREREWDLSNETQLVVSGSIQSPSYVGILNKPSRIPFKEPVWLMESLRPDFFREWMDKEAL